MSPIALLLIYIAFRVKHFVGDFILQTDWMAMTKGVSGKEGYKALLSHTVIHAAGTFIVTLIFAPALWWLALVDFAVHTVIDRVKGRITKVKEWKPTDTVFWWAYGLDQELHNYTHLAFIVVIVLFKGGIQL